MDEMRKMQVLSLTLDDITEEEAVCQFEKYMASEAPSLIDLLTADRLMVLQEEKTLEKKRSEFDLLLAADPLVLEESGVTDAKRLEEARKNQFLNMVLGYLGKNNNRVYILAEKEEKIEEVCAYLAKEEPGIEICGAAKIHSDFRADDMVINAINGSETDCVLLFMSSPLLETFMMDTKHKINARVCLGLGENILTGKDTFREKIRRFTLGRLFKSKTKTN